MEIEKTEQQGRDTFVLLDDFLHQAKRMWLLGLALVLICAAGLTFVQRRAYRPVYEASASFTVRVANPLYASVSSYNEKTAQVMADTFPSILTSGLLQRRVMDELGIDEVPAMSVSATAQSSILTLKVRDTDPQRAYDVMSAVIACYPEVAEFVVGSTVLVLLDESGMPTAPVAEFNYRYYITRGAVVGAAVWCVILAFLVLMKNTVHNEDELRETLNAPCLGQNPRGEDIPEAALSSAAPVQKRVRLLRIRPSAPSAGGEGHAGERAENSAGLQRHPRRGQDHRLRESGSIPCPEGAAGAADRLRFPQSLCGENPVLQEPSSG